jgi:stage II sporulation protein D
MMIMKRKAPEIEVGIFSGGEISFTLNGIFRDNSGIFSESGRWIARCPESSLNLVKGDKYISFENTLMLEPAESEVSTFTLHAVTIGVNFHWQRKEDQVFKGKLKLIIEENRITAVNVLSLEDYLISVISSEMKATSSAELLKAHAVISRSWLLAQIEKSRELGKVKSKYETQFITEEEIVRWYDREDHKNFDVCADDHCQRYQGTTRASTPIVEQVIKDTYGEVLAFNGAICDTRYSKCCGGITEIFENVWEPVNHPYLQKVIDNPSSPSGYDININNEENVKKWILGNPDAFCNTSDKKVLSQVLNDYDQETNDFYRWKITYTENELSDLVKIRTGIDFGKITALIPLERGSSGRIIRLRIEGTKKTMVIGKELEIRKALSKTHLYSSCFIVVKCVNNGESSFILHGAGWGHGVGLCQIGAALMSTLGYSYHEILAHYFRGAVLETRY